MPFVVNCATGRDRLLGGIALTDETHPTPSVLDTPDLPNPPTVSTSTDSTPTDLSPGPGGPVPVGPGQLSRTMLYICEYVTNGLHLGQYDLRVTPTVDYPETAVPGAVLPARRLELSVELPELLRLSMISLLDAYELDGFLRSPAWSFTTAGRTIDLADPRLTFRLAKAPQKSGQPWTMRGPGTLPAITVPGDASEPLWLRMPATFLIDAMLYRPDHTSMPTPVSCTGPQDGRFGGIAVTPTTEPTTEHTPEPTAEPAVEPTVAPTVPTLIPPTVQVGALGLWRTAVFTIGVGAKGALPTGNVVVKRGDRTVARGRLFLGVTVVTAGNLPRGEHTFTITYEGDVRVAAKTVTKKMRIL